MRISKERLKEIKDKVSLLKNSSELQPHEFLVDILHLDWLIQQAEEKIILEQKVKDLEEQFSFSEKFVDKKVQRLAEENQRYKQALEEVLAEAGSYMGSSAAKRLYEIARQALQGGNNNENE